MPNLTINNKINPNHSLYLIIITISYGSLAAKNYIRLRENPDGKYFFLNLHVPCGNQAFAYFIFIKLRDCSRTINPKTAREHVWTLHRARWTIIKLGIPICHHFREVIAYNKTTTNTIQIGESNKLHLSKANLT
jgi:hypothetical protein